MYYIKESEWLKLETEHKDYCGRSISNPEIRVVFEGAIPDNNGEGGTTLLFENRHFKIISDAEFTERKVEEFNNEKFNIEYNIHGIKLSRDEMFDIKQYYETACTAEFILENYSIADVNLAMQIGSDVRHTLNKYDGITEVEAIETEIQNKRLSL